MYIIEWLGGRVEHYHSKESFLSKVAKYKKYGFHENWDFYCFIR